MSGRTYSSKGVISVSGAGFGLAAAVMLANLAIAAWFIYLLVCIAGYVNAWPF